MASSSFPIRLTVTTYNLWGGYAWPERANTLLDTLNSIRSDVFLFQEITREIVEFLDKNLAGYSRVVNENKKGWISESNIYWNNELLEMVEYGLGDLKMVDYPNRGLFWARLRVRGVTPEKTLFVSTAHFPWVGNDTEIETGVNQRILAAAKVCENIRHLVSFQEMAIFAGDLNEDFHPVRIIQEECAFFDVFELMDLPPPVTHPVRPSNPQEEMRPSRTIDWILCSLPSDCRVVGAFVKGIRGGRFPPPSDHFPVVAIFEIK